MLFANFAFGRKTNYDTLSLLGKSAMIYPNTPYSLANINNNFLFILVVTILNLVSFT